MDTRGPSNFNPDGEASTVSTNWTQWVEEFEAYADSKGLFDIAGGDNANMRAQRKALLLYHAGPRVREINRTLAATARDEYAGMVTALNNYFTVEPNVTFQRHLFRKHLQNEGETIAQYCARLRKAGTHCGYNDLEAQIRDQIVESCLSESLRRKLLEEGNNLTLAILLTRSATHEAVEARAREMSNHVNRTRHGFNDESQSRVHRGSDTSSGACSSTVYNKSDVHGENRFCGRCGKQHKIRECPAFGKQCFKCKGKNHFQSMCKSSHKNKHANVVNTDDLNSRLESENPDSKTSFAFCSGNALKVGLKRVDLLVGGIVTNFIIDTGADCNIMGKKTWEILKGSKLFRVNKHIASGPGGPNIYPYTGEVPIQVIGRFWANVSCRSTDSSLENVQFSVIAHDAEPLLGIETAIALGVVKFANVVETEFSSKFPKLFSGEIGKANSEIELTIREDIEPIAQPYRRVAFAMMDKLEKHLQELVDLDIIEKVEGPTSWVSPVVIVPKPNNKIRLCIDMRQANRAVVRHHYPVPTIDELLRDMNGAQYFSKIDLKMGFHQFVLSEKSRDITTFNTHVGLFRYKRLMFGINAAPEIYQREVANIIRGIPGVANLADDIVVHGKSKSEHDQRLLETMSRLEAAGMTLNGEKCVFGAQSINFLGHQISDKGVDPGPNKVEAIAKAEVPKTVMELKSFLGLVGYCSKFISFFSDKTEPLRRMTIGANPNTTISFSKKELDAFNNLKKDLSNTQTLAFFDIKKDTVLYTDASPVGLGAILIQYEEGAPRIVCYVSRALTDVETRYMQTEKEALAIVWACERLHHYLFGVRFTLLTDHQALEVIYGSKVKKSSLRIERWVLRLQSYDFQVKYVKGSENIADPLSRLIKVAKGSDVVGQSVDDVEDTELYVRFTVIDALTAITAKEVEKASFVDSEISQIREAVQCSRFDSLSKDIPGVYRAIRDELCVVGQLVLRGNRIVVPKDLRDKMLELGHEGHLGIVGTKKNLRAKVWWPGIDSDVEKFVKHCHGCQLTGACLPRDPVRVTELPNGPWEDLSCDLLGPLPNGEYLFVVIDYYSRYYEVKFMNTVTSVKIIEALQDIFDTHGIPVSLKSDNGPQFVSEQFKDFAKYMGFHHHLITPRWPEANGEVERQNRSLMKRIKIAFAENLDYKVEVRKYIVAYRNTPHTITGKCPSEVLFGRKVRTRVPHLADIYHDDQELRDKDSELKHSMVEQRNIGRVPHTVSVGDFVLLKRDNPSKVQTPFHTNPFVVREVNGPMLVLESGNGRIYRRNVSYVRPYSCSLPNVVGEAARQPIHRQMEPIHREMELPYEINRPDANPNQNYTNHRSHWSDLRNRGAASLESNHESVSGVAGDGNTVIQGVPNDTNTGVELRRSSRATHPPQYLNDYVR